MEQLIPAASALIIHKGKVLLVCSNTTQDQWTFPGGKQENNETPQQTVIREINEDKEDKISVKSQRDIIQILDSILNAARKASYDWMEEHDGSNN